MQIVRYNNSLKNNWDTFVRTSKNGTFLFYRDFMEYHSDRFDDCSLLFFENDILIALLPANLQGDVLYSHQGLTYGGLLLSPHTKTTQVLDVFDVLLEYLKEKNIIKLVYKVIPHIYHIQPAEEDLYALFRKKAMVTSRAISSTICSDAKLSYSQLRKRKIKQAVKEKVLVTELSEFEGFWSILEENLRTRYKTQPVHSLYEINLLKSRFPSEIRLFCALKDDKILAGCLVFVTDKVAHIQYISASEDGKRIGALDIIFDKLINEVFPDKKYFDFGISTEDGGFYLNEGLISQKEGFGARGVVYDTYQIDIK